MALSKLLGSNSGEAADEIIALFRQVSALMTSSSSKEESPASVQVPVSVRLWRVPGCHELLASLGFDLTEVLQDVVILKSGKAAFAKRQIQYGLQALIALFETQDAPRYTKKAPALTFKHIQLRYEAHFTNILPLF